MKIPRELEQDMSDNVFNGYDDSGWSNYSLWYPADFKSTVKRGISPMDGDAILEIDGYFLWIETKNAHGRVKDGQERLFQAFTANSDKQQVVIINGSPDADSWNIRTCTPDGLGDVRVVSRTAFHDFIRAWSYDPTIDAEHYLAAHSDQAVSRGWYTVGTDIYSVDGSPMTVAALGSLS